MKVLTTRKGNVQITMSLEQAKALLALVNLSSHIPAERYRQGYPSFDKGVAEGVSQQIFDRLNGYLIDRHAAREA